VKQSLGRLRTPLAAKCDDEGRSSKSMSDSVFSDMICGVGGKIMEVGMRPMDSSRSLLGSARILLESIWCWVIGIRAPIVWTKLKIM
jgi:hypothetical protein